jgi:hypothetical protein
VFVCVVPTVQSGWSSSVAPIYDAQGPHAPRRWCNHVLLDRISGCSTVAVVTN